MVTKKAAAVQARRRTVAGLWIRGLSPVKIALQLETPLGTIRRDLEKIRTELTEANRADLERNRDRSVAVLRSVQEQAWALFTELKNPASTNKVGALNTIVAAEERIARIQGTLSPDVQQQQTVNVLALGEWTAVRGTILRALADYPEARSAVVEALSSASAGETAMTPAALPVPEQGEEHDEQEQES